MKSLGLVLFSIAAAGQSPPGALPDGPGKDLVEAVCGACHEPTRVATQHFSKTEWQSKVLEMLQEDPDVTQQERDRIVDYLANNFRPKINVNKAPAKDLAEALELSAKDADAIARYREKNGNFKTIEDLKKVPGLDAAKIEVHRERLDF
ncbi:MAG: uptake protein and related DNA-binding protein-like protein [Bryobacterales bacterium]|nr:uptake protein and related DNA-binding protein-like protein [Bryobacterales bacterium]